ncbi:cell wall-binding repeat-containing protein [Anaerobacillus sp. CMMVII]|uniref:cell wall-binding repeat-containing protein n=1 Tax=Anaerobacillus sp. CMMVII TaxID=2755588 RepID=UPI0021B7DD30|nr:cell wall-binding repeat-containing protein [Anaerobacillus sp. CMMVII]MCT8137182.1 cell wall-binding repeat-containing protein [Anaerobacillus sp. CMMVII]
MITIFSIGVIVGCSDHGAGHDETDSSKEDTSKHEVHNGTEVETGSLLHLNTKNVTRLNSNDAFEVSVMTSQMIWPATHSANQPGTIILAPFENWQLALASLNLVHHPNDGPVLFTDNGEIPAQVMAEIQRLQPKGNVDGTQIMVMGELSDGELDKLNGYQIESITEVEPAAFAAEIDHLYGELTNNIPSSVIIGSMEEKGKLFSIPAGSWITHMDEPILYVTEDEIPEATSMALQKRNGKAAIYVVGPESVISNTVVEQLGAYGKVIRIAGETPEQVSIEFAKYRDHETNFGWNVVSPGHGLVMLSTEFPELAITAAPFAHLGKHAPMVWLPDGEFSEEMHNYLADLKPTFVNEPTEGPYNHAYLIGGENLVPFKVQGFIDEMLEIVPADGEGHGGHGSHGH